jgi:hypothetical protein
LRIDSGIGRYSLLQVLDIVDCRVKVMLPKREGTI